MELQCYLHCEFTVHSWCEALCSYPRMAIRSRYYHWLSLCKVLVHPRTPSGILSRYHESEKKVYRPKQMIASFLLQGNLAEEACYTCQGTLLPLCYTICLIHQWLHIYVCVNSPFLIHSAHQKLRSHIHKLSTPFTAPSTVLVVLLMWVSKEQLQATPAMLAWNWRCFWIAYKLNWWSWTGCSTSWVKRNRHL